MIRIVFLSLIFAVSAHIVTANAQANTANEKQPLAARLEELNQNNRTADAFVSTLFEQLVSTLPKPSNTNDPSYVATLENIKRIMIQETQPYFDKLSKERVNYFTNNLSKKELTDIIQFLESDTGQKFKKISDEATKYALRYSEPELRIMTNNIDQRFKDALPKNPKN